MNCYKKESESILGKHTVEEHKVSLVQGVEQEELVADVCLFLLCPNIFELKVVKLFPYWCSKFDRAQLSFAELNEDRIIAPL